MMPPERTLARIPSWLLEAHQKLMYKLTVCSLPVVLVFWYKSTLSPRSLYFRPVSETAEGVSGPARHDSDAGSTHQVALRDLPRQRSRSLVQERTADSTQRPHQHHTQKQVSNINQGAARCFTLKLTTSFLIARVHRLEIESCSLHDAGDYTFVPEGYSQSLSAKAHIIGTKPFQSV